MRLGSSSAAPCLIKKSAAFSGLNSKHFSIESQINSDGTSTFAKASVLNQCRAFHRGSVCDDFFKFAVRRREGNSLDHDRRFFLFSSSSVACLCLS